MIKCDRKAMARCPDRKVCGKDADFAEGSDCDKFNQKVLSGKAGKPTNGDRFRTMSNEKLAAFLEMVAKRHCFAEGDFPYHPCNQERDCKKCALDWLNQPAEEG